MAPDSNLAPRYDIDGKRRVSEEEACRLGVFPGELPGAEAPFFRDTLQRTSASPIVFAGSPWPLDFSQPIESKAPSTRFGIGQWNEDRVGVYDVELFNRDGERRTVHMGLDLAAEVGTPVFSVLDGVIFGAALRLERGDYGGTVIVKSHIKGRDIYALYGHLSGLSVEMAGQRKHRGEPLRKGELLGWIGDRHENGDWPPHLHFQWSWLRPREVDLPGAVALARRKTAIEVFPEPLFF